ncbi:MAG TPA: outer membrane lipoprotein-sorting protein [Candidatus Ozemobacteraceae bacterium]|nr:outer membrane lipoprotein-sorting protein [Candidatus Ozemobacteraceae bacterium]
MNKWLVSGILVVVALLVGQAAWAMTADEVLKGVEDRYVGKTSKADTDMVLIAADGGKRTRKMNIFRQKADNDNKDNFIHFLSPADIKDTTYLVNEKSRQREKRIYLSAMKNVRRIVADDYGMAFVSSDFTYEDMDDIHASDYACSNLREEKLGEEPVWVIDTVKSDGKTSYAKSTLYVSKEKMLVLKAVMYDKKSPDKVIKEMTATELEKVQDIWTPKMVEMKDLRKNTSTQLRINAIQYDVQLDGETFSERNMKKS